MADLVWLMRRLEAMSVPEVGWRVSQKLRQEEERLRFGEHRIPVTRTVFNRRLAGLKPEPARMHLALENRVFSLNTAIRLPGGFRYEDYRTRWNAGFQTDACWPDTFSCDLDYRQCDSIGDARTNWELNRHLQFVQLAKNYRASGDSAFLQELSFLFDDWNRENPFLHGISWTSVMEIAVRCSSWCYTCCFLDGLPGTGDLLEQLRIGILNMTDYVAHHYSRFSSANNHLIIDAFSIGQSGILFHYRPWVNLAIRILTRELPLQNYSDGVNRELSLYYQIWYMEAMGLMLRLLKKNGIPAPAAWAGMLKKMSAYTADCLGSFGEAAEFGDNDESRLLDLSGETDHYPYILGLMSCLLDTRYTDASALACENLCWLFSDQDRAAALKKPAYRRPDTSCYREGGVTMLHSRDGRILIGIDHGALGFGPIAAHGHADALSFQLFADGRPVLVDPGTYISHCDLPSRNMFRSTEYHNTLCIGGRDQSEMQGAFLWGRKARCRLLDFSEEAGTVSLKAAHDGYGQEVIRSFCFDGDRVLTITDEPGGRSAAANFLLGPGFQPEIRENTVFVTDGTVKLALIFAGSSDIRILDKYWSGHYGLREPIKAIAASTDGNCLVTRIELL